jgi:hypothetical protein
MAKNFVPQTGQVRAPGSLTGSSTDLSDSAFTASAFGRRVQDLDSKALRSLVHWIGEERLLDGG